MSCMNTSCCCPLEQFSFFPLAATAYSKPSCMILCRYRPVTSFLKLHVMLDNMLTYLFSVIFETHIITHNSSFTLIILHNITRYLSIAIFNNFFCFCN